MNARQTSSIYLSKRVWRTTTSLFSPISTSYTLLQFYNASLRRQPRRHRPDLRCAFPFKYSRGECCVCQQHLATVAVAFINTLLCINQYSRQPWLRPQGEESFYLAHTIFQHLALNTKHQVGVKKKKEKGTPSSKSTGEQSGKPVLKAVVNIRDGSCILYSLAMSAILSSYPKSRSMLVKISVPIRQKHTFLQFLSQICPPGDMLDVLFLCR